MAVKYLGTKFDDKLSWQYHIQMVTKTHSIAVGILSKLWHKYLKLFLFKLIMVLPTLLRCIKKRCFLKNFCSILKSIRIGVKALG